jgi:putative redox protein
MSNPVRVRKAAGGKLKHVVEVGHNSFVADEPLPVGDDEGPSPHEILDAALATCTAMTVLLVARRKQWPLQDVRVEITHEQDDDTYRMDRKVELVGELTQEQKDYLLGIANKCPVHRTLHKKFEIATRLA